MMVTTTKKTRKKKTTSATATNKKGTSAKQPATAKTEVAAAAVPPEATKVPGVRPMRTHPHRVPVTGNQEKATRANQGHPMTCSYRD